MQAAEAEITPQPEDSLYYRPYYQEGQIPGLETEDIKLCGNSIGNKGFNIIELIVVVIIIGILAALAVSQYFPARENAFDKEAKASLRLIQAAEKIYNMEVNGYYSNSTNAGINTELRLSLPTGTNRAWDYSTSSAGAGNAQRLPGGPSRTWILNITEDEPHY